MNNNQIIGYDPQTGQPIYQNNNIQNQPMQNNQQYTQTNMQQSISNSQSMYSNIQPPIKNKNNNKLIIGLIILFVAVILIVTGIILLVNNKFGAQDRTIMIYMVGSNLESESGLGTVDLNSIDYDTMDNENINVVLIAGGSTNWYNNYISKDETSIYELTSDGYKK